MFFLRRYLTFDSIVLHRFNYSNLLVCSPDSDKIKLILDEVYAYSKKEILKVKQNLDDIYGPSSEEKKNGINQLHEHLKVHIAVSYEHHLIIVLFI